MRIKDKVTGKFITHSLEERFWEKVDKKGKKECWKWKGFLSSRGYGRLRLGKGNKMATAVSWYIKYGVWPTLCMCHKCDNPCCVNPDHLFEGTHLDNAMDRTKKGRTAKGSRGGSAKTDEKTVLKLKEDLKKMGNFYGINQILAAKYNVNHSTVSKIKYNKHWKHV